MDFEYDADAYFPNLDEKPEWQITVSYTHLDVYKRQVLDEYYTNGLLPCESKREGKKCLFELKQRLL